jgi:hypothetical protein
MTLALVTARVILEQETGIRWFKNRLERLITSCRTDKVSHGGTYETFINWKTNSGRKAAKNLWISVQNGRSHRNWLNELDEMFPGRYTPYSDSEILCESPIIAFLPVVFPGVYHVWGEPPDIVHKPKFDHRCSVHNEYEGSRNLSEQDIRKIFGKDCDILRIAEQSAEAFVVADPNTVVHFIDRLNDLFEQVKNRP